jgi:hypothetical protein
MMSMSTHVGWNGRRCSVVGFSVFFLLFFLNFLFEDGNSVDDEVKRKFIIPSNDLWYKHMQSGVRNRKPYDLPAVERRAFHVLRVGRK